jgi:phage shock protein PspC (stress-responsive transcriptional regulator)
MAMTSALPPTPPAPPTFDPPAWAPPPPPGGPPARPQLRRSRTDKILGGVSGGLAEYSGIDALLWRVGFVALALAGGTGVIVYLLLWLLMPADPTGAPVAGAAGGQPAVRRPREPRSPVPGLTIAGLLIVVGVMTLIDRVSWLTIGATDFLGAALLVVATGLIAAAFTGGRRARGGLIALGGVLSLALVASTADWRSSSEDVGDRTYRPTTVAEVRDVYRGGLGDFTLDLSRLDVSDLDETISTEIQHDIGDVRVVLPVAADVRLSTDVDLGSVDLLGQGSLDGGCFPGYGAGAWVDDDTAEFDLIIANGLGDVEVSRG